MFFFVLFFASTLRLWGDSITREVPTVPTKMRKKKSGFLWSMKKKNVFLLKYILGAKKKVSPTVPTKTRKKKVWFSLRQSCIWSMKKKIISLKYIYGAKNIFFFEGWHRVNWMFFFEAWIRTVQNMFPLDNPRNSAAVFFFCSNNYFCLIYVCSPEMFILRKILLLTAFKVPSHIFHKNLFQ